MKKIFLLLLISLSTISFSQRKEKFKKDVQLIEKQIDSSFQTPQSILFEFYGNTHLIYFYKDLAKNLIKIKLRLLLITN
jgi:hypothetical protein